MRTSVATRGSLLLGSILFIGCSGVTPSIKVAVGHQFPGDFDTTSKEFVAWAWSVGGSIKASFPTTGPVIEPCGAVGYTRQATNRDRDTSTTGIPGELCVEIDTTRLSR